MTPEDIISYCTTLDGVVLTESWGEKGIFYNPDGLLKRGVYVLTVKEKDGENDRGSTLDRQGVFRVNIGVRKKTFLALFGDIPKRPQKGGVVDMDYDFTETDRLLPHPVYAWMGWVCVLDPTEKTFEQLKATPHNYRLAPLSFACLHIFRHIAQISFDGRQPACTQFVQSDEKSDGAIKRQ